MAGNGTYGYSREHCTAKVQQNIVSSPKQRGKALSEILPNLCQKGQEPLWGDILAQETSGQRSGYML